MAQRLVDILVNRGLRGTAPCPQGADGDEDGNDGGGLSG